MAIQGIAVLPMSRFAVIVHHYSIFFLWTFIQERAQWCRPSCNNQKRNKVFKVNPFQQMFEVNSHCSLYKNDKMRRLWSLSLSISVFARVALPLPMPMSDLGLIIINGGTWEGSEIFVVLSAWTWHTVFARWSARSREYLNAANSFRRSQKTLPQDSKHYYFTFLNYSTFELSL